MANPVEIYCGARLLFRFNPTPSSIAFSLNKVGNSPMDIPTFIRPWMYDFTSQDRNITVTTTLMNMEVYNAAIPGTGTILDQLEDLLYLQSGNWTLAGTQTYLEIFVPYQAPLSAGHDLTVLYPPTGNTDYLMDISSVPSGVAPVGGPVRALYDKIYYIYPQGMEFNRDEAGVNRVHVTMTFKEVWEAIKI